jgi:hypothetical protein
VALRPRNENTSGDQDAPTISAEQEMLMREVDEAVRHDQFGQAAKRFGWPLGIALVLGLAGFGGWLYMHDQEEAALEQGSEQLIMALDAIDAGNDKAADDRLAELVGTGTPGAKALARLTRAGLAAKDGRIKDAIAQYEAVAADTEAPQPYRDLATIRAVAAGYDEMDPQAVVDRLKPLAVPGNPWFASAGEIVGMAYLDLDKPDLAGPLFAEIAKSDNAPEGVKARTRQLAGLLGFDAVPDVDIALAEMKAGDGEEEAQAGE